MTTSSALADAIVTALNTENAKVGNGVFSQDFTAVRKWVPVLEMEDIETKYNVTVAPVGQARRRSNVSRARYEIEHHIQIGVQKGVDPDSNTECDAVHALAVEIAAFCDDIALSGVSGIIWVRTEMPFVAIEEHLRGEVQCFTSVVEVIFLEHLART